MMGERSQGFEALGNLAMVVPGRQTLPIFSIIPVAATILLDSIGVASASLVRCKRQHADDDQATKFAAAYRQPSVLVIFGGESFEIHWRPSVGGDDFHHLALDEIRVHGLIFSASNRSS